MRDLCSMTNELMTNIDYLNSKILELVKYMEEEDLEEDEDLLNSIPEHCCWETSETYEHKKFYFSPVVLESFLNDSFFDTKDVEESTFDGEFVLLFKKKDMDEYIERNSNL